VFQISHHKHLIYQYRLQPSKPVYTLSYHIHTIPLLPILNRSKHCDAQQRVSNLRIILNSNRTLFIPSLINLLSKTHLLAHSNFHTTLPPSFDRLPTNHTNPSPLLSRTVGIRTTQSSSHQPWQWIKHFPHHLPKWPPNPKTHPGIRIQYPVSSSASWPSYSVFQALLSLFGLYVGDVRCLNSSECFYDLQLHS